MWHHANEKARTREFIGNSKKVKLYVVYKNMQLSWNIWQNPWRVFWHSILQLYGFIMWAFSDTFKTIDPRFKAYSCWCKPDAQSLWAVRFLKPITRAYRLNRCLELDRAFISSQLDSIWNWIMVTVNFLWDVFDIFLNSFEY